MQLNYNVFIYRQILADNYPSSFGGRKALLQIVSFPAILLELDSIPDRCLRLRLICPILLQQISVAFENFMIA